MQTASIVILNANVITLNPKQPKAEAIAIRDNEIIAVDSNTEIRKHTNKETRVIDAKGKTIVPGLVDCHVHMTSFGRSLQEVNLRDAESIGEIQRRLREYAEKNPGKSWILGGRWDQEKCVEKRFPNRWDLDAAVKDRPVFLTRVCGHAAVANSKALQLAGVTRETAIGSGQVEFDQGTGEPNGILREDGLELVRRVIPKPTLEALEETCFLACQKAVEAGLTCVHWMVDSAEEIRALQRLHAKGELPLRVCLGVSAELLDELDNLGLTTGFGNDTVKIGFVKIFADGSLGARTAALEQPYTDKPETKGILVHTQRRLNQIVLKAHEKGLQVAVHAIGDRAIETAVKAFSAALKQSPRLNHRHRIEHCSVLNPRLIKRMKQLGLTASIQPHFVVSDFWVEERVGKARARWTYPFRTIMREGIVEVSGSDCPVEPINPLLGIWAVVARRSAPEESLPAEEALKTYTLNATYASFDEDKRGTLEVGKLADLTILSDNLLSVPPEAIRNINVEMTIANGRVVYSRNSRQNSH